MDKPSIGMMQLITDSENNLLETKNKPKKTHKLILD